MEGENNICDTLFHCKARVSKPCQHELSGVISIGGSLMSIQACSEGSLQGNLISWFSLHALF